MATMRLYKPASERYETSYSYQSAYAKPEYNYGLGQSQTQHYSESKFQNQSSAFAPATQAAFSAMVQQSSYFNSDSGGMAPALGGFGFPTKPVEQHSSSHAYSQHGSSSYGMGQQGAFSSAQHVSYGMRRKGGIGGFRKQHGAYSSHGSQNGSLGPVQQSYGSSQHGSYSSGSHGPNMRVQHGSPSSGQHGSYGSAAQIPSTNWAMNRRQKSSYYRRSKTGYRSGDGSDSEEEEEEDEEEEQKSLVRQFLQRLFTGMAQPHMPQLI
uniref:Uncharacterized protein n=1 Tax=Kalanchoe fedtschenkoi TaxID=63787 RepID=A0A7N0VF21_KALFE